MNDYYDDDGGSFWLPDGSFDFNAFREALKFATLAELKSLLIDIEEDILRAKSPENRRIYQRQYRIVLVEIRRRRAHRR